MKKLIACVIFLMTYASLFAFENGDFNLSVMPKTGFSFGRNGEYLYSSPDSEGKDFMLSSLEWNTNPLFQIGAETQAGYKNLFANIGFVYYLPFVCGKMYDSDYTEDFKKNYCILENKNKLSIDLELSVFYKFNLNSRWSLSPVLGGQYSYNNFTSNKGYGWFGDSDFTSEEIDVPWNDPRSRKASRVSGIDYQRATWFTFAGLSVGYKWNKFSFDVTSLISPFAYTKAIDYHRDENVGGNSDYHLIEWQSTWFNRWKEEIKASYELKENILLVIELQGVFGPISRGKVITDAYRGSGSGIFAGQSDWKLLNQASGADIYLFNINFGGEFKF